MFGNWDCLFKEVINFFDVVFKGVQKIHQFNMKILKKLIEGNPHVTDTKLMQPEFIGLISG